MSSLPLLTDGDYTARLLIAPTRITRPFLNSPTKDAATKVFERLYEIDRASYTPFAALATLPAEGTADPADAAAYLVEEGEPELQPDGTQAVRCLFSHIPAQQTVVGSYLLSKPSLSGSFPQDYGSFRIFQPDTTLLRYDVYASQTVLSDSGAPAFAPTGGTYTLSFGGATTAAIAYNASSATVQTELNALTPISNRGSVTVTGTYNAAGGFTVTFNSHAQITISTGSLTGGTISKVESLLNSGYSQLVAAFIAPAATTYPRIDFAGLTYTGSLFNGASGDSTQGFYTFAAINGGPGYGTITGGTFTISIVQSGTTTALTTTAAIAYNATLATVQLALDAMAPGLYTARQASNNSPVAGGVLSAIPYAIGLDILYTPAAATGGTYTLTAFTQTTSSLAYNASAATVSTALNTLGNVINRGGCTVSGDLANGFTIAFANPVITADATSLVPSASTVTPTLTDGTIGRTQQIIITASTAYRNLYVANHGITVNDVLYLRTGAASYPLVTTFTVPDANTIRLSVTAESTYAAALTISTMGRRTRAGYEPGTRMIRSRRITDFYLPGVTAGITTADDITVPVSQSDGPALLLALFAGAGTLNCVVGELTPWRGPILSLTKTTINAADA